MQNDTLKRIALLLKDFDDTFEIGADIIDEGGEQIAKGLKIKGLKNDGSNFVNNLHDTFNSIVEIISSEHEVIYHEEKGLVIAKRVVRTDYIIEDVE